jgi:hypothetical protein
MPLTDAGLIQVKQWKELTAVNLGEIKTVGDPGMAHFKECKKLRELWLQGTSVGDAGLAHVKEIKSLKRLKLDRTDVGDAGLAQLAALDNLTLLELPRTKVTAKGVESIAKALPKCKIEWDGGVIEPR